MNSCIMKTGLQPLKIITLKKQKNFLALANEGVQPQMGNT